MKNERANLSIWIILVVALGMASCGGDDPEPSGPDQNAIDEQLIQDFLTQNSITATRGDSGVYYYPLVENPTGNTQQISGNVLSIYYTVNVLNGQTIDQVQASTGANPVKLKQGVNAVYPVGLDIGLAVMREGETYKFLVPSSLGYGDFTFSTLIPANAVLEFEVELVSIENEAQQLASEVSMINSYIATNQLNDTVQNPLDSVKALTSGIFYKRISAGAQNEFVQPGQTARITYTGTFLDDTPFHATTGNQTFDYPFAQGVVIQGLDSGVAVMERGERALLIIPSLLAYRESVRVIPGFLAQDFVDRDIIPQYATRVPPYRVLVFDTSLL